MSPFNASSTAPREEGKEWCLRAIFPLFFKLFQDSFVRQTWTWWLGRLGFPFLLWALGSVDGFWAIFIHVLSTVDQWICWALDPWWITEILNLIHGRQEKWASTNTSSLTGIQMLSISKGINNKYVNCKNDLTVSEVRIFKLLQWKVYPMVYKPLIWTQKITIFFFLISRRCHY